MSISFPTSLDALTNPTTTSKLNSPSHAGQHSDANDAIEALEVKVGVDSSAVTTSLDYLLKSTSSSNPGHKHTLANGATNVTATATEINYLSGVTSPTGTGALVLATSPTLVTPTLGVATATTINKVTITAPATSATLTLAQGSSIITSGAYAITFTSTNTTGVTLPTTGTLATLTGTETFTNKRNTKRITTIVSNANPTINTDNCDCVTITAQAAAIASMTTNLSGTPNNFDTLVIRIKDDGSSRNITWGASFASRGATLPTATTASKVTTVGFFYNSVTSTWDCVASITEA
jgi:hypothetical protein